MTILAIDQGTTSTRALAVPDDGHAFVAATIRHQQHYPNPGWVEHDPLELIRNLETALDSTTGVKAVGIDNQGESCMAWHAVTKEPISPVIVWQDNRTGHVIDKLKCDGVEEQTMQRAGLPLDSYFSASKLAWIMANVPLAKQLRSEGKLRLGTTDAYFLDRLAGEFKTDITTASRTSLMNLDSGQWDEVLCQTFDVPIESLPEIVPTTGHLGTLRINHNDVPVTASVVDQQASLYGHGCRQAGDAKITFGTGAFALMVTGPDILRFPEQGLLPTVAWHLEDSHPEYALDGGVYCAGSAIEWAHGLGLFNDYASLNTFTKPAAVDRDLVFVPALTGLACPHWDRRAGGLWIGLTLGTDQGDLMQSMIEGIALRTAEVIRTMASLVEVSDEISIDGGVSTNPYFCQFLADSLGKRVTVRAFAELTAIGTAQLAGAEKIDVGDQQAGLKNYEPAQFRQDRVEKFSDAVSRARQWNTSD